ncbi:uncharacterized protein LOC129122270 isoform X2 [Agelaius phoeniceus]
MAKKGQRADEGVSRRVQEGADGNSCQQMSTGMDSSYTTCWNLRVCDGLSFPNNSLLWNIESRKKILFILILANDLMKCKIGAFITWSQWETFTKSDFDEDDEWPVLPQSLL